MSYTPGPWTFSVEDDGIQRSEHEDGTRCRYIRANGTVGALMGGTRYYPWTPDNEDDWRLMASAPDLLAACKLALSAFERNDAIDWGELGKAIAKAEGQ